MRDALWSIPTTRSIVQSDRSSTWSHRLKAASTCVRKLLPGRDITYSNGLVIAYSAGEHGDWMRLASCPRTFSLCSVHSADKLEIFSWLELSSAPRLDAGVSDRGVSISVSKSAMLGPADEEVAVDERV